MDTFSFFSNFPAGPAVDTFSSLFLTPVGLCHSTFVTLGFIINSELRDLRLDHGLTGPSHNSWDEKTDQLERNNNSGRLPITIVLHINAIKMVVLPRLL